MEPTCPWDAFEPAAMHFCERELCAWIEQPINTWTNLAYLLVGALILVLARRDRRPLLGWIGVIAILQGFGSALFHASSTHVGEVVDEAVMYLFASYALVMNLGRLAHFKGRTVSGSTQLGAFAGVALLSSAFTAVAGGDWGIVLFAALVITAGSAEDHLRRNVPNPPSYRPLWWLLGAFAVAWAAWWIDVLQIGCNPDNHWFQGHGVWHVVNSTCFYFLYAFYRQLPPQPR